jgi:hypothetical protein
MLPVAAKAVQGSVWESITRVSIAAIHFFMRLSSSVVQQLRVCLDFVFIPPDGDQLFQLLILVVIECGGVQGFAFLGS